MPFIAAVALDDDGHPQHVNLKTAIRATYHHFKFRKYTRRDLAEAQYRVNRRSLVGRLLHASARTEPCPEHWLRLGVARAA